MGFFIEVFTVGSLYYAELKLCEVVYQHIVLFYLCDIIIPMLNFFASGALLYLKLSSKLLNGSIISVFSCKLTHLSPLLISEVNIALSLLTLHLHYSCISCLSSLPTEASLFRSRQKSFLPLEILEQ